jgi:hypothetical protein
VPSKHVSFSVNNFTPYIRCQFRRFKFLFVCRFHYPKKPRFKTKFGYKVLSRQFAFHQPEKVLRALFFFTSTLHVNAVTAYFSFSRAGHSILFLPSPQQLSITVFSNQKINAETPGTSEDGRTRRSGYFVVRRVKSGGFTVVARVKLCTHLSSHTILARVKILFLRKPRFEITFGGRGLSRYDIFLG